MTDNVKHSTSYFHEVLAKAFEMFKNGYEPVMETPFQPRRQGSAFVVEYKLVREELEFPKMTKEQSEKISEKTIEAYIHVYGDDKPVNFDMEKIDRALNSKRIEVPDDLSMEDFDDFMKQCVPLPAELLERMTALREKAESNRAVDELVEQAQELDMGYDKQLTIQEKWEIDDQINSEADAEKELAGSESCGKLVYTKEQLDAMHWNELKPLLDEAGIKGRRRQNLIRDFLKKQEEKGE